MRQHRPRTIALAMLGVLAVLGCGVWLLRDPGPEYQGKPVNHWFPRIQPRDEHARLEILSELARGGPEVLPLLVAAAKIQDGRLARRYQRWHHRLPEWISTRLPAMRYADSMQSEVAEVIWRMPESEPLCRALTNAMPQFSDFLQGQLVRWMSRASNNEAVVDPCLLRVLNGAHDGTVIAAAQSLLALPRARTGEVATIIRVLGGRPESVWTNRWAPAPISIEIADLGPTAAEAEDWMRRWLVSSNSQLRACAAVTLPALSPARYPVVETFAGVLSGLTAGDIRMALNSYRVTRTRDDMDWLGLVIGLSPLLDPARSGTNELGGTTVKLTSMARNAVVAGLVDVAEVLGPKAAPLASPLAKSFASLDPRSLGLKTAMVLARIGPVAPGTIPDLIPGLEHVATAPTLVLLLAAYGKEAKAAIPRLREMAEGKLGFDAEVSSPISPALARRYGLSRLPEGVLERGGVVAVWPYLAMQVGLTNSWPLPREAQGQARLEWTVPSGSSEIVTPGVSAPDGPYRLPPLLLPDLAAEALRRIEP
ncbi:MAG: hypothetical protein IT581_21935 [Verrucomicrobiales bacterium]|nr:hypothetical protein [Verrucomicrobiales bacterium]